MPAENVMGGIGNGAKVLMSGLDYERAALSGTLGISGRLHGPGHALYPRPPPVQPAHRRIPFPCRADRRHVHHLERLPGLRLRGPGLRPGRSRPHAARCRRDSVRLRESHPMAGEAIQTLGGNGYINDYPAGRLWRDAKLYEIGAGTNEIRRMLIGRELFAETA